MSLQNGRCGPARIWLLTLKYTSIDNISSRSDSFRYAKGQREIGEGGFDHWQFIVYFGKPIRLAGIKKIWPTAHAEPSRSVAAESYVWKDETAVVGSRFEVGTKPINRSDPKDWETIKSDAIGGRLDAIPPDIYIRCYNSLRRIESDHLQPVGIERQVFTFWGTTGSGKSRRAWAEAGFDAYPKDPRSKFWDGYRGHENVVIDEFRGGIDISHMLRWLDRYPTIVEVKGSSTVLKAKRIWITSNLDPRLWYPDLDSETLSALLRRMEIKHFVVYLLGELVLMASRGCGTATNPLGLELRVSVIKKK